MILLSTHAHMLDHVHADADRLFLYASMVCSMKDQREYTDGEFARHLCQDVCVAHASIFGHGRPDDVSVSIVKMSSRRNYAVLELREPEQLDAKQVEIGTMISCECDHAWGMGCCAPRACAYLLYACFGHECVLVATRHAGDVTFRKLRRCCRLQSAGARRNYKECGGWRAN